MTARRPEPPTHGAGYDTRDCTRQSPQRVAAEQPGPPTHDRIVKNSGGGREKLTGLDQPPEQVSSSSTWIDLSQHKGFTQHNNEGLMRRG